MDMLDKRKVPKTKKKLKFRRERMENTRYEERISDNLLKHREDIVFSWNHRLYECKGNKYYRNNSCDIIILF